MAFFQSAEWIRVRVHQMEPDLMDVGSNLEEALQLQHEHQELLFRLKVLPNLLEDYLGKV